MHAHVCNYKRISLACSHLCACRHRVLKPSFINSTSSSNLLLNCEIVMAEMEIIAHSEIEILCRPCVDCGQKTGCYCDNCKAKDRVPSEKWADNQQTPLCTECDRKYDECHFCRGLHWCRPFEHGGHALTSIISVPWMSQTPAK